VSAVFSCVALNGGQPVSGRRIDKRTPSVLDKRTLTAAQKQSVLDFVWLCDQLPAATAYVAVQRVTRLMTQGTADELEECLRELNLELRRELHRLSSLSQLN
jgi:hypothetical protein